MQFIKVQQRSNPQYLNLSLILFNDTNGDSLLNYSATTFVDMLKVSSTFSFSLQKNEEDLEYQNRVLRSTIDLCRLRTGATGNFVAKMLMENFHKCADFTLQCPMKAGPYNLLNFNVSDAFIPSYLILGDINFMIDMHVKVKIPNVKSLVNFYSLRFYGQINKND